jgi:tryptophanyl-tRNA synthetase
MLANTKVAMEELEKSANTNFDNMTQTYINGCKEMKNQVLKGNQQMMEKFQDNYKQIQQG